MTRRAWLSPGLLLAAPVLFFAAFFLAPLAVVALAATVAAVLLTVPAALALARYEFPGKAALTSVLMS
ncbi:hypothetical protein ACOTCW_29760, partial [Achromobacter xylosoxidans]